MRGAWIVFAKEFRDTLRDRRTILAMIVIPLVAIPLMVSLTARISKSQHDKVKAQTLKVALITNGNQTSLAERLSNADDIELMSDVIEDSAKSMIQRGELDGAIVISGAFTQAVAEHKSGRIKLYYKSGDDFDVKRRRLTSMIEEFENELLTQRLEALKLSRSITDPVHLVELDLASSKERFGKVIGGFLPYMFLIFCFMGSMYPAIDLAAGEKERGTLETLLTAPVSNLEILVGKLGVVVTSGLITAIATILGMYVGMRQTGDAPEEIINVIASVLEPQTILLILSLLVPTTIFFAGVQLSTSMFAKSFKEAQSLITPAMFLVIIPVAIGLIPGIALTPETALIPILNVSLATKEIIAGTIDYTLYAITFGSLVILALMSLFVTSRFMSNESIIFRN
jgi:sodium transport system permease protein